MDALLSRLSITAEIQTFFNIDIACFDYGDGKEIYNEQSHFVPRSRNLWMAGNSLASELVISRSAMECLAFFTLNRSRFPAPENVCFVATGNLPAQSQLSYLHQTYKKQKITLVFENDILGRLTDAFIAATLKGHHLKFRWQSDTIAIDNGVNVMHIAEAAFSLNQVEIAFGFRSRIRTRKPHRHNTFLDQLKHDNYK